MLLRVEGWVGSITLDSCKILLTFGYVVRFNFLEEPCL